MSRFCESVYDVHCKDVRGIIGLQICATLTTPFSGSSAAPKTNFFTPTVSSYALRFQKKKSIFGLFSLQFWQNSAPNTLILVKICT